MASYLIIQKESKSIDGKISHQHSVIDVILKQEFFKFRDIYKSAMFVLSNNPEEDRKKYSQSVSQTIIKRKKKPTWDFTKLPDDMHNKAKDAVTNKDYKILEFFRQEYSLAKKCSICTNSYDRWLLMAFSFYFKTNF